MEGPYELIVMAFHEENRANEVLGDMKRLQQEGILRVFNAAVLVKNQAGKTSLKETEDVDAKRGAIFGAIVGGLIGLLGGPAGAVLGAAAGAATGGIAANQIDLGFSKDFLDELKQSLSPGSSALIAIVEHEWVERIVEELEKYQGKLLRHALKSGIAAQLAEKDDE